MKIILHHPTGHPYWQHKEFKLEMPDGSFFDFKDLHADRYVPGYTLEITKNGLEYFECHSSSGTGKYKTGISHVLIRREFITDIEYKGKPLLIPQPNFYTHSLP